MLTVTTRAIRKLKQTLYFQATSEKQKIRLVLTPSGTSPFDFILDEEAVGDHIVLCEQGSKVLLVGPTLASALSKMEIDYCMTPVGCTFALMPSTPVN